MQMLHCNGDPYVLVPCQCLCSVRSTKPHLLLCKWAFCRCLFLPLPPALAFFSSHLNPQLWAAKLWLCCGVRETRSLPDIWSSSVRRRPLRLILQVRLRATSCQRFSRTLTWYSRPAEMEREGVDCCTPPSQGPPQGAFSPRCEFLPNPEWRLFAWRVPVWMSRQNCTWQIPSFKVTCLECVISLSFSHHLCLVFLIYSNFKRNSLVWCLPDIFPAMVAMKLLWWSQVTCSAFKIHKYALHCACKLLVGRVMMPASKNNQAVARAGSE